MQGHHKLERIMLRPLLAAALILTATAAEAAKPCATGLPSLLPQIVRKEAVAAVDESFSIHFWQFCQGYDFHDLGNAAALTRTIAANPLLAEPIRKKGWRPDDVMFVRVDEHSIDLWLHRDP